MPLDVFPFPNIPDTNAFAEVMGAFPLACGRSSWHGVSGWVYFFASLPERPLFRAEHLLWSRLLQSGVNTALFLSDVARIGRDLKTFGYVAPKTLFCRPYWHARNEVSQASLR